MTEGWTQRDRGRETKKECDIEKVMTIEIKNSRDSVTEIERESARHRENVGEERSMAGGGGGE